MQLFHVHDPGCHHLDLGQRWPHGPFQAPEPEAWLLQQQLASADYGGAEHVTLHAVCAETGETLARARVSTGRYYTVRDAR